MFFRVGSLRRSLAHVLNRFSSQNIDKSIEKLTTDPKKKFWKEFINQDILDPFACSYLVNPEGNLLCLDEITETYEELIGLQFTHSLRKNNFSLGRVGYCESLRDIEIEDKTISLSDLIFPSKSCEFYLRVSSDLPTLTFEKFEIAEMKKKLTKLSKQFKKFRILVSSSRETTLTLPNLPQSVNTGEYCSFYQFGGFLLVIASSVLIVIKINTD